MIDRLPFPHADDPVLDALKEQSPARFWDTMKARAIMRFRQGVGRLLRTRSDVGVVVVLDRRLVDKPYGKAFLASLPRMVRVSSLATIRPFLEAHGVLPSAMPSPRERSCG